MRLPSRSSGFVAPRRTSATIRSHSAGETTAPARYEVGRISPRRAHVDVCVVPGSGRWQAKSAARRRHERQVDRPIRRSAQSARDHRPNDAPPTPARGPNNAIQHIRGRAFERPVLRGVVPSRSANQGRCPQGANPLLCVTSRSPVGMASAARSNGGELFRDRLVEHAEPAKGLLTGWTAAVERGQPSEGLKRARRLDSNTGRPRADRAARLLRWAGHSGYVRRPRESRPCGTSASANHLCGGVQLGAPTG